MPFAECQRTVPVSNKTSCVFGQSGNPAMPDVEFQLTVPVFNKTLLIFDQSINSAMTLVEFELTVQFQTSPYTSLANP
jgi:hypothetical protein